MTFWIFAILMTLAAVLAIAVPVYRKSRQLDALRSNPEAYNAAVPTYNAQVRSYNAQLESLRVTIAEFNRIVGERNEIATQERELVEAIDTRPIEL